MPNTSDPSFPEESHLYTEVDEAEKKRDGPYVDQKYENPLYEPAAADDSELNPIYGRFVRFNMNSLLIYNLIWNMPKLLTVTKEIKGVIHLILLLKHNVIG